MKPKSKGQAQKSMLHFRWPATFITLAFYLRPFLAPWLTLLRPHYYFLWRHKGKSCFELVNTKTAVEPPNSGTTRGQTQRQNV